MKYSYLGKTGMKVPVLSFGASSLGGVFHSVREAEAIRAVFTAVENGMNFIDVSPYYESRDCIGKGPDGIAAGVVPLVYQSRTLRCRRSEHVGLFCKKDSGECV